MEPANFTKRFSESSATEDSSMVPDLEFPVEPNFRPDPPLVSLDIMAERIQQMREMFPNGIPTEEERLARKTPEEFVLKD
jgi:hypothetical protein